MGEVLQFKLIKKRKPYRRRARPQKINRTFRFDQEKLARLEEVAQRSGMTVSEYIRELTDLAVGNNWLFNEAKNA
ncbi:hypothetical protein NJG17_08290 [Stenotrophomonas maltophilia]|jgi:predicted DNA-binding protein|uniref:plasmid mobilization protein n=1 Tax=Stenotrophomonas maltophilia TaxID=40324 RepID=UPI000B4E6D9B|nr:hypothetical protein [Stenotrophomonas maltophilia]MBH1463589.1 hypothetical protein [Stenotrophomonas maltophilia]MBH1613773.1 hypothetical protein [Stenotrophomonas maltophilia]MBN5166290.1 hypothetical protein [Stenotrophomonas maltophilia]MCO7499894.1 hypothetical protein [Stenotrophomonas maltophilia]OWQ59858.1 hypothetical protein CEE59_06210 [Stenotrophomonas maltophilia]